MPGLFFVSLVADLLTLRPRIEGAAAVEVRRPVPADGILQDALFTHPGGVGKPARVTFPLRLPRLFSCERLLFVFDTALSDGIPAERRSELDGVALSVEAAGQRLFSRTVTQSRWLPGAADLTPFAGRSIDLTLIADARDNLAYDWALWGRPRLLRVNGVDPTARIGLASLTLRAPATVRVAPDGPGMARVFSFPAGAAAVPFAFPDARGVRVSVSPPSALTPGSLRLAAFAPKPVVTYLGPTHPVRPAGLRAEVRNDGEGWLPPGHRVRGKALPALAPGQRAHLTWPGPIHGPAKWQEVASSRTVRVEVANGAGLVSFRSGGPWREVGVLTGMGPGVRVTVDENRVRFKGERLPTLYVGRERSHAGALFPGIEYLSPGEPSSSPRGFAPPLHERTSPPPDFVTVPVMAVTLGEGARPVPLNPPRFWCPDVVALPPAPSGPLFTVGLLWEPQSGLRPEFAVPDPRYDAHRMALTGGKPGEKEMTLFVAEGPALVGVREWLRAAGGLPPIGAWPRSREDALALCRKGWDGLWDPARRQWRATFEGAPETIPGIAALLWWDGLVNGEARSAERAQEGATAIAPERRADRAAMHLMRFELPFLAGDLGKGLAGLEDELRGLMTSQRPDGGWRFGAKSGPQASLGRAGDAVSGTGSHAAWMLLRYARITGDPEAMAAGERALTFFERFDLPRGASVWECPIYEPDVLAAGWLVAAHVEGYRATGKTRWLAQALRWAETAVPFLYLWGRPDRPAMPGASIATFGTTFYTHAWLGRPVQWEGLLLAWHLRHLADALGETQRSPILDFGPREWRHLADLLLASGLHQQVTEGTKAGLYPDSVVDFREPQPVFLNPENLMALLFEKEPEIRSVRKAGITLSAMGWIEGLVVEENRVRGRLRYFPGATAQVLMTGLRRRPQAVRGVAHWQWDPRRRWLTIAATGAQETVEWEVER